MKKTDPINDNLTSRVIPGLKSEYRIVSLPFWAWFWLDDFMQQNRISYQGMLDSFACEGDVNQRLKKNCRAASRSLYAWRAQLGQ